MKKETALLLKRAPGYGMGILLFFAPFAYYQKALSALIGGSAGDIHSFCLRIPLLNLLTGKGLQIVSVASVTLLLLVGSAFLLGPFFCGRLCAGGAIPEYLSRLVPERLKINWQSAINPAPVRYGFLAGYLISPFLAGSIACALCNYSFTERLITGSIQGNIGVLGSTAIVTGFLWLGLFGIMAKGGRGFCSFLCPVGAVQSAVHSVGARLGFTCKLRYAADRCVNCGQCVKNCPTGALHRDGQNLQYQIHHCITCRQCASLCPQQAVTYGTGTAGWVRDELYKSPPEVVR